MKIVEKIKSKELTKVFKWTLIGTSILSFGSLIMLGLGTQWKVKLNFIDQNSNGSLNNAPTFSQVGYCGSLNFDNNFTIGNKEHYSYNVYVDNADNLIHYLEWSKMNLNMSNLSESKYIAIKNINELIKFIDNIKTGFALMVSGAVLFSISSLMMLMSCFLLLINKNIIKISNDNKKEEINKNK